MRITRKLPRTLSLIAAIFWLLTTVVGFITGLSNCFSLYGKDAAQITVYITTNLLSSLPSLICVLVLFVGKSSVPAASGKPYIKSK